MMSPLMLWKNSNFDGSQLHPILSSDPDPMFCSALLLCVYLPFSPSPSVSQVSPQRIVIDEKHTYGTLSSQLAGPTHPKEPTGQRTIAKTSRTRLIYII